MTPQKHSADETAIQRLETGRWFSVLLTVAAVTLGGAAAHAEEQQAPKPATPSGKPASQQLSGNGFDLIVQKGDDGTRVQLVCDGQVLVSSPADGVWSVATDWQDAWPTQWKHAGPDQVKREGEWLVLSGRVQVEQGEWLLRDAYRAEATTIRCVRRWQWKGKQPAAKTTLSVRWTMPQARAEAKPLLPGICYCSSP
jgi:hypothetical protein